MRRHRDRTGHLCGSTARSAARASARESFVGTRARDESRETEKDALERRAMATHMGKPVKEILERGFESSSNANASQFEHEGCAETLGEPKRKSFAREAHNAREAAEAALLAAQADEKADEDRIHDSVETVDPHDLETVKFCGQEAVMREVFPWATRVTSFLRIPTQLTLTLIALVYIPVVIHTQIVFTVLCFWSIVCLRALHVEMTRLTATSTFTRRMWPSSAWIGFAHSLDPPSDGMLSLNTCSVRYTNFTSERFSCSRRRRGRRETAKKLATWPRRDSPP